MPQSVNLKRPPADGGGEGSAGNLKSQINGEKNTRCAVAPPPR